MQAQTAVVPGPACFPLQHSPQQHPALNPAVLTFLQRPPCRFLAHTPLTPRVVLMSSNAPPHPRKPCATDILGFLCRCKALHIQVRRVAGDVIWHTCMSR
ncbi:hypothetical protein BV20DRAFT_964811 [Pilatotrama ljubarskyi]|nr:hypothetical protein BV20DRAFT_964811 [Pilatotrama ljubarskyi]